MARYCFYCQRQLEEGERCTCHAAQLADAQRQTQRSAEDGASASPEPADDVGSQASQEAQVNQDAQEPQKTQSTQDSQKTKGQSKDQTRNRFTSRARDQFNKRRREAADRRKWKKPQFDATKTKAFFGRFIDEGRSFVRQIPQMLRDVMARPENILALARRASNQWVIIVFLLEVLVTTLVLSLAYKNSSLGRFVAFALNSAEQVGGATSPSPFALRIILFAVSAYWVRIASYLLALRFNFVPITMQQAMRHAVPGGIYFTLVFFFAIFFNRSSGIQVLFILALAWAVRFLIDEKILRDYANLREDRLLPTLIGIYLFTFLIMALVISLALPKLSHVRLPLGPTIVHDFFVIDFMSRLGLGHGPGLDLGLSLGLVAL